MQPGFAHSSGCASNSLASLGAPKKEVYFMAIIDILTPYDAKKKAAHAAKTVKHGVSSLLPAGRMGSGASALPAFLCVCVRCLLTPIFYQYGNPLVIPWPRTAVPSLSPQPVLEDFPSGWWTARPEVPCSFLEQNK